MAKQRLGRGLGSLMEEVEEEDAYNFQNKTESNSSTNSSNTNSESSSQNAESGVKVKSNLPKGITSDENGTLWLDINLLKPNPRQPRQYFNEEDLAELTESVKSEGVLQAITVEDAGDGTFYIIAGERRTRAAKAAGLEKVPVQLRKFSDVRKLEVALIENIQRTDLNPVEEAQAYYKLMELSGITQEEVAKRVGKNRSTVANCLRLLKLPEDMQRALIEGTLTSGHARALLSVENQTEQRILFGKIQGQGLSVRQAESYAHELNEKTNSLKPTNKKFSTRDPNYVELENKLIETLGTKVNLKGNFNKGSIEIKYFSSEDLDRIFNLIVK